MPNMLQCYKYWTRKRWIGFWRLSTKMSIDLLDLMPWRRVLAAQLLYSNSPSILLSRAISQFASITVRPIMWTIHFSLAYLSVWLPPFDHIAACSEIFPQSFVLCDRTEIYDNVLFWIISTILSLISSSFLISGFLLLSLGEMPSILRRTDISKTSNFILWCSFSVHVPVLYSRMDCTGVWHSLVFTHLLMSLAFHTLCRLLTIPAAGCHAINTA